MTHPPFVDWNMTVTKELGANGYVVSRTVEGCDDFQDAQLDKTLGAAGYTVSYTPDGCADEEGEYTGPLDEVPGAGWRSARSATRALSSSMLGEVGYTLRNSGGGTINAIYDATDGSIDQAGIVATLGANDGFLTSYADHSAVGLPMVQATEAVQLQWKPNIINSLPAFVGRAGVNPSCGTESSIGTFTSYTSFHVIKASGGMNIVDISGVDNSFIDADLYAIEPDCLLTFDSFDDGGTHEQGDQTTNDPTYVDEFHLIVYRVTTETLEIIVDGVTQTLTGPYGDEVFGPIQGLHTISSGDADTFIRVEDLVADTLMSAQDILTVSQNIATYYNITLP